MAKSEGNKFALTSPTPNSGGTCFPVPHPVIYAYANPTSYNDGDVKG